MEGIINNFRGGKHTKYDNQMIVIVKTLDTKAKAKNILGKKVVWESPAGKKINGTVSNIHGNSGAVKVLFEKGMPGQAIGQKVIIG